MLAGMADADFTISELRLEARRRIANSGFGSYSAPSAPVSDFAMLEDDDSQLPF